MTWESFMELYYGFKMPYDVNGFGSSEEYWEQVKGKISPHFGGAREIKRIRS